MFKKVIAAASFAAAVAFGGAASATTIIATGYGDWDDAPPHASWSIDFAYSTDALTKVVDVGPSFPGDTFFDYEWQGTVSAGDFSYWNVNEGSVDQNLRGLALDIVEENVTGTPFISFTLGGQQIYTSNLTIDETPPNANFTLLTPVAFFGDYTGPSSITAGPGFIKAFGTYATVPEPSTWALLLAGFFGLGLAVRRQRRMPQPTLA